MNVGRARKLLRFPYFLDKKGVFTYNYSAYVFHHKAINDI